MLEFIMFVMIVFVFLCVGMGVVVKDYERAKAKCRELDKLHPAFRHIVGIRYHIVRIRKHLEGDSDGID